jgi:hypothetical protein
MVPSHSFQTRSIKAAHYAPHHEEVQKSNYILLCILDFGTAGKCSTSPIKRIASESVWMLWWRENARHCRESNLNHPPRSQITRLRYAGLALYVFGQRSIQIIKDFSSNLCVQTGSGAHPASCTMGTGGPFPGGKARPRRDADHSHHLVPKSWMSRSYTSSLPKLLHGV